MTGIGPVSSGLGPDRLLTGATVMLSGRAGPEQVGPDEPGNYYSSGCDHHFAPLNSSYYL